MGVERGTWRRQRLLTLIHRRRTDSAISGVGVSLPLYGEGILVVGGVTCVIVKQAGISSLLGTTVATSRPVNMLFPRFAG